MNKKTRDTLRRIGVYVLSRFMEASTWRGLVLILTSLGLLMRPESMEAVVALGLFLSGLIGAAVPESFRPKPQAQERPPEGSLE